MNAQVLFLLVGAVVVFADITEITDTPEDIVKISSKINEAGSEDVDDIKTIIHKELFDNQHEQNNEFINDINPISSSKGEIDVVIENYESPNDILIKSDLENSPELSVDVANEFYTDMFMKLQDETMDTAASIVPIPIFRRRKNPNKNYATRRNFYRNPYRRAHFYPYYSFYRPYYFRFY